MATIISQELKEDEPDGERTPTWRVHLRYQYVVNQKVYEGWRYSSTGEFYGTEFDARQFAKQYVPESKVQISYDQNNPAQSVMRAGTDGRLIVLLSITMAMALFTLAACVGRIRPNNEAKDMPALAEKGKAAESDAVAVSNPYTQKKLLT